MAIDLDEDETVSVPPDGKKRIFLDENGDPKLLSPDGTRADMGGGGGGAVTTDGVTIGGDGTSLDPLTVISGSFGSDTLVQLPNSAAAQKTVSEWISAYSNNAAGAEQSTVTIKVLYGGAQEIGLAIDGQDTIDVPGFIRWSFDNDTGFRRSSANTSAARCGGTDYVFFSSAGLGLLSSASLFWSGTAAGVFYASGTGVVTVKPGASGNVDLGPAAGALNTTATSGFVSLPTCAGTPTGAPTVTAGQALMVVDTTNAKIYGFYGGAWHDLTKT